MNKIKAKLAKLKLLDKGLTIFGAEQHMYQLNSCLTAKEVADFELSYDIQLPEAYRTFLVEVGNGGAGPAYGLLPLAYLHKERIFEAKPVPANFLKSKFKWSQSKTYDEDNASGEYWEDVVGSIPLADYGCGMMARLVTSGESYGEVWLDDRASDYGIVLLAENFLDWYESWLDQELGKFYTYASTRDFFVAEVIDNQGTGRGREIDLWIPELSKEWHCYYIEHREFLENGENPTIPALKSKVKISLYSSSLKVPTVVQVAEKNSGSYFIPRAKDCSFTGSGLVKKVYYEKGYQMYCVFIDAIGKQINIEAQRSCSQVEVGQWVMVAGTLSIELQS